MPDDLRFATKPQIALEQIRAAQADGIPPGVVLADAGYGVDTAFRDGITALGLAYVVGIQSSASLWPPGQAPLPVKPWSGRGRPPTRVRRSAEHKPVSAKDLAAGLPRGRLAPGDLAPGDEYAAHLPLCRRPRAPRPPRLQGRHGTARGMVPDRMAVRGSRAHQVLALDPARHASAAPRWSATPCSAGGSSGTIRS